jgi:peptide/nickel transport system ATP-binding protein/oligopeptide transport system ATP-binding protein
MSVEEQAGAASATTVGAIMEVQRLRKDFRPSRTALSGRHKPVVKAVDDVSFALEPRRTMALVGESGSGKTTLVKMLLDLERPTAGTVLFKGVSLGAGRRRSHAGYRAAVQAVFQDPSASLDPRRTVRYSIGEPLRVIHRTPRPERDERVRELLELVGLDAPAADGYPHELSGGMQQRVAIARALAPWPSVLILDEPVSALDVSIKAQVMNLLKDLQEKLGLAYLVVAHDLATVRFLADRVAVMYLGRLVEVGEVEAVFENPRHPYTQALLAASLAKRPGATVDVEDTALMANVGSASDLPSGCRFHPRCPWAVELCSRDDPSLLAVSSDQHAACHAYAGLPDGPAPGDVIHRGEQPQGSSPP